MLDGVRRDHHNKYEFALCRQEALDERLREALSRLDFGQTVLGWLRQALKQSHADERQECEAALARLRIEYDRRQDKPHALSVDKLDGRIDKHFFDKLSGDWRAEQERCLRDIGLHQTAEDSYLDEAPALEMAQGAALKPMRSR